MQTISKYFIPRQLSYEQSLLCRTPVLTRQVVRRSLRQLSFSKVPLRDEWSIIRRAVRREMSKLAFRRAMKAHKGLGA